MKTCPSCGNQNLDQAKFCNVCGNDLQNVESPQSQQNTIQSDVTQQQGNNQTYNEQNYQQQYNNQQNSYQTNYKPYNQKNAIIAVILDIIPGLIAYLLCGIGQLYLGLYKRGLVLCALGFVPMIIGSIVILAFSELLGSMVSLIIGVLLVIYAAYDAYICTAAINEGRPIPLLFGTWDLQ